MFQIEKLLQNLVFFNVVYAMHATIKRKKEAVVSRTETKLEGSNQRQNGTNKTIGKFLYEIATPQRSLMYHTENHYMSQQSNIP